MPKQKWEIINCYNFKVDVGQGEFMNSKSILTIELERPRRLRQSAARRALVEENFVRPQDLVAPLFFLTDGKQKEVIKSMPGHYRLPLKDLLKEVEFLARHNIGGVCLFPAIASKHKDKNASYALNARCPYYLALREIKKNFPEVVLMTDVALDPYSSDGHDGLVDHKTGEIKNDETVAILAQMAVMQAEAGADIIGPSDMMDGRVKAIRVALEAEGFHHTMIMSYTAKYASAFYGPFRDALDSAPKKGDKKTYQMNPANRLEALRELALDSSEGADIVMVKPGLPYLDIIRDFKEHTLLPVAAYNVSGEYALIKLAAERGLMDFKKGMDECLVSFKRAGADIILTYFAREFVTLSHRSQ